MNHSAPSGPCVMLPGKLLAVGIGNAVIAPSVVIRPILLEAASENHSAPSGPGVMPVGRLPVGSWNSVITPVVVMRPILLETDSVNHSAPSGPVVIASSERPSPVEIMNSVTSPAVVMRPILALFAIASVNHSAPSGPVVMPAGEPPGVGSENSVNVSASACLATPTTAHSKMIAMSGDRRYRFHMCSPLDTQREGL